MAQPPARLRFGVMCRGLKFPAWQARCLQNLLQLGYVEPALLIVDKRAEASPSSPWKKLGTLLRFRASLFSIYNNYVVPRRCEATRPVDMSDGFAQVPRLFCEVVRKGKFSEYFQEQDIVGIRKSNLDFILRFAFGIIRGDILQTARYGVWSFHHGDEQKYRGAPPCFWEIYNGEQQTGAILQRLTERLDGGVVLRKGWFPTVHHSYPRNRDAAHFLGVTWPAEVCADIVAGRAAYLGNPPVATSAPIYLVPKNRQTVIFGLRQTVNNLRRLLHISRTVSPAGQNT